MLAIGPIASKQRLLCPWQSWISISGMTDIRDYTKECKDPRKFSDVYNIDIKRHSLCQLSSGKIVEIHSEPFLDFTSSRRGTWKSIQGTYSTEKCTLVACGCSFYSRTRFNYSDYISKCMLIPHFECPLAHSKCSNVNNLSNISSAKAFKIYQQLHLTKTSLSRKTFNDVSWIPLKVRSYPHWIFVITIDYLSLK